MQESTRTPITEEMKVHEQWLEEAKGMTLEKLPDFINHLLTDYGHDYGTICHAITAGAIATAWAMNKAPQGGITGCQAGFVMWGFIQHWSYLGNKTGLRIIDYDNMLYPQYRDSFQRTISPGVWEKLQEQAQARVDENPAMEGGGVYEHWQSIAKGIVPFGYLVREER